MKVHLFQARSQTPGAVWRAKGEDILCKIQTAAALGGRLCQRVPPLRTSGIVVEQVEIASASEHDEKEFCGTVEVAAPKPSSYRAKKLIVLIRWEDHYYANCKCH